MDRASPLEFSLETPILLLAMPQVLDPFFHKSVVLLVHHEEQGSFGFIVNRPTGIDLAEVLRGMDIDWHGNEDAAAFFGGPVQPQLGTVLFSPDPTNGHVAPSGDHLTPIGADVWMSQHIGDLAGLAADPPRHFRLILGYAGWGEGQLAGEITRNDWLPLPVDRELVFAAPPDQTWELALQSLGVDPATLPSWTAPADDEVAN